MQQFWRDPGPPGAYLWLVGNGGMGYNYNYYYYYHSSIPCTLNPKPLNPKPYYYHSSIPYTLNPKPLNPKPYYYHSSLPYYPKVRGRDRGTF